MSIRYNAVQKLVLTLQAGDPFLPGAPGGYLISASYMKKEYTRAKVETDLEEATNPENGGMETVLLAGLKKCLEFASDHYHMRGGVWVQALHLKFRVRPKGGKLTKTQSDLDAVMEKLRKEGIGVAFFVVPASQPEYLALKKGEKFGL